MTTKEREENTTHESLNFIEQQVEQHLESGRFKGVHTRFPPEPNGFLHIGHVKAIWLNFTLAAKYGGKTNLRFDDTNPTAEKQEFVDGMREDIHWLGYDWEDREFFASDYFDQLYEYAVKLVSDGFAYVEDSTPEDMRRMRGTPTEPGEESPFRNRSVEENLDLLARMKAGEFEEGAHILRAKIDMASPNMHLRDPALYRILKTPHHRTGTKWNIYPMYDWAHGQSDSIEGVTHSICTIEFEVHRPLYDWFVEKLGIYAPQQIEFARLNISNTITAKRKLRQLVEKGLVNGWDDPRMPTVRALRRAGYTAASLAKFCERTGVAKRNSVIDVGLLEFSIREDLNKTASRVMAVLDPVKLVIDNLPKGYEEMMTVENNPEMPEAGSREMPFSRELWIERGDFMEDPPRKFFRLGPGRMVRLKGAYIIECTSFERDDAGKVSVIHCDYVPTSRSGNDTSGLKVKGTIHWVSAAHAGVAEVRLYDRLFLDAAPDQHKDKDFLEFLNPDSLQVLTEVYIEASLKSAVAEDSFQFLRKGYFCVDRDSTPGKLVFNRTVTLRDNYAKKGGK